MKFKEYFEDVLNQNKDKLKSAESEELELLRKLEQIRKKQTLYKKNIKEIEQKLKGETIKVNKELFGDTKKIDKELNVDSEVAESNIKNDVKQTEFEVKDNKYQFGDPDFFKVERKVINKNQTVLIDKDFDTLESMYDQGFETNRLIWYMEYEDSKTVSITDVEVKGDKLKPEEITEEFANLFNYILATSIGNKINMVIELNQLFDAIVDMSAVNSEDKNQIVEQYRGLVEFFERDEPDAEVVNPSLENKEINHPDETEDTEADNDIDYWELYE